MRGRCLEHAVAGCEGDALPPSLPASELTYHRERERLAPGDELFLTKAKRSIGILKYSSRKYVSTILGY